jgi:small subunit ribosomal protein S13
MARLFGVDIPANKKVTIALTSIFGIGNTRAAQIIEALKIDSALRAKDLTDAQVTEIVKYIEQNYEVEGDLRRQVAGAIRRLQAIVSYRGLRHRRGLPVRGQRTKTNARTRKGKKRTVGAIRDKAARKMAK